MKISQKTRAIVLRSLDYGESDRILTFLTDDFGKLKGGLDPASAAPPPVPEDVLLLREIRDALKKR